LGVTIDFEGRSVIVTGAGGGLGRAYALDLAARGAHVVINDIGSSEHGSGATPDVAEAVCDEIRRAGGVAVPSTDSVADPEGCGNIAETARRSFGRIDAVIHNAGIVRNTDFGSMAMADFQAVLQTHLIGAFALSSAVYPDMCANGYGRFVFTSSATGTWGRPSGANYGAAKAGLIGLCNGIGHDGERHGVLANCVLPVAATRLAPGPAPGDDAPSPGLLVQQMGARGSPTWVAPLVVFLASEACDFTRHCYAAVGGRYGRVFVGSGHGWEAPAGERPTPDDIAAHLEAIDDVEHFDLPASTFEHIQQSRRGAW
jgi:NAD(P)-dependent dehydrogenase (short-subunit alcohol dehydrogenase family)